MEEVEDLWYFDSLGYLWRGALGKYPKHKVRKEILTIDRNRIRGNRSSNPET
jgi:hypothetical protein